MDNHRQESNHNLFGYYRLEFLREDIWKYLNHQL